MSKLKIVYEDQNLIVLDKPPKLLTIASFKSDHTLYSEVSTYVKKQHKSNKIFIVHRLDKDTSGLIVFAKNIAVKTSLQATWPQTTRKYEALVEGHLKPSKGDIKQYLTEDKNHYVHVTSKGEFAHTSYEVIKYYPHYTHVSVTIHTGKKNQIRVAFSSLNHPIVGDKKYGQKKSSFNRLMLHASYLSFTLNGQTYTFKSNFNLD